jgi:hypothetical protein
MERNGGLGGGWVGAGGATKMQRAIECGQGVLEYKRGNGNSSVRIGVAWKG